MSNDSVSHPKGDKPRAMTLKGWLHKSNGKVTAAGFLTAHRKFLETGEVAEVTSPILRMLDEGQLLPTPALDLIRDAVAIHMLRTDAAKAEAKLLADPSDRTVSKNWIAQVWDAKGNLQTRINANDEVEVLEKSFDLASDADRWCDRRLFDGASDWFATVCHTSIMRADGSPISTTILRSDAIARVLKAPKQPFSKKVGSRDNRLSFGIKAKQDHASFSRG